MKGELTELQKRIYHDIQKEIYAYYDIEKVEYKESDDAQDTILDFFSYLLKLIPVWPREVYYSKELSDKIESGQLQENQVKVLREYEDAFRSGKDMNSFLSNRIKKVREADFLLYTWHLYHLHMSGKFVDDPSQMKNNRSDTQLLCIIHPREVYFVDVIRHPRKAEDYFDIRILEIIRNNGWMEKIGFYEIPDMVPGSLQFKVTESKDIFQLYTGGINTAFEFHEKGYGSVSGITCAKRPVEATQELIRINRGIAELSKVEGSYKGFCMGCDENGVLKGIVTFETEEGEIKRVNIL